MQTTIHDPRILACQSIDELVWSIQAITDVEESRWERAEQILGTIWYSDAAINEAETASAAAAQGKPADKMRVPLSLAIRPELMDHVNSYFNATPEEVEQGNPEAKGADSMWEMSKADFLAKMGRVAGQFQSSGVTREAEFSNAGKAPTGLTPSGTRSLGG